MIDRARLAGLTLMSPATTPADVARHTEVFAEAVSDLLGAQSAR